MTLNEMIYQLRLKIRANKLFDDDELDDRLIKKWIKDQRALWLRNEINKNRSIDDQVIQKVCMTLAVADRSDCPLKITDISLLKTTQQVPKTIELNNTDGILRIAPVDKLALKFSYVPIERAQFGGNGRFNSSVIFAFRYDNYIYLFSKKSRNYQKYIRFIMLYGLFEDPEALADFKHVNGEACFSADDDYPVNSWMWTYMMDQILSTEFNLLVSAPTDRQNDSTEQLTSDINVATKTK